MWEIIMNIKILIIKIPTSTADETDFCTGCKGTSVMLYG